jgi:anhydro-N-acetylmuramic acid kinase
MIVAGVMSGTSADGINVAIVKISPRADHNNSIQLLGHAEFPYPARVRKAILSAMNAESASVADLARLNFFLGALYSEAIRTTEKKFRMKVELAGCHGQTLYHQGTARPYLGKNVVATWQTGEAAVIAANVGVPVVSDFRPADMAAGGKGAPLVPYLDYLLFRDARIGRIVQNIGGIANLTAIPAAAKPDRILAFDTGPGNMVIDAVTDELFGKRFDRGGKIAATGQVRENVLERILAREFFRQRPPKTAGREEFGREFVRDFQRMCGRIPKADAVATATALTARSIALSVERFVLGRSGPSSSRSAAKVQRNSFREMILSGGGAKNQTLVAMLADALAPMSIRLRISDDLGLPSEAKEAVAFAVLAFETWNRKPSNVPSATGARRPAVLGKISYV